MKKTYRNVLLSAAAISTLTLPVLTGCGSNADIGKDKASQIAFEDAGVSETDVSRLRITKDRDDGKELYEVQFTSADKEYEYDILASDGSILSVDSESLGGQLPANSAAQTTPAPTETAPSQETPAPTETAPSQEAPAPTEAPARTDVSVSLEEASKLALDRVPGASAQDLKIELELDDGYYKYEGDIIYQQKEYEFEIDANSGTFLEWSEERYD